jgi:hypothetical protein
MNYAFHMPSGGMLCSYAQIFIKIGSDIQILLGALLTHRENILISQANLYLLSSKQGQLDKNIKIIFI